MAMTLQDMIVGMTDKVTVKVIETFIRMSQILDLLPFDNCISPGGGSTMTYGYMQTKLPSLTAFRAINQEYTASEATQEKKTVDLKVFGGAFSMDRVLKMAEGKFNNMAFQYDEKVKSAVGTFHNGAINGDSTGDANTFDGLDKLLVGETNELNTGAFIDLSTIENAKANADAFYEQLTKLINLTGAQALLMNADMKTKITTIARILGYKTASEQAFGRQITVLNDNVRLVDLGNVVSVSGGAAVETPIIGKKTRTIGEDPVTNLTDIYAARFSVEDGFCGVTLTGSNAISQYTPDFNQPGAVKKGEVEMVAAVALKNTRAAGVLRNVKI